MRKCGGILSEQDEGRALGEVQEDEEEEDDGRGGGVGNGVCSNGRGVHDVARFGGGAGRGSRAGVSFDFASRSGSARFSSIVCVAGGRVYVRCCERSEGEDQVQV
ncbi:unnamed protein product [Calypogeia fissa]